ncbi:hypothetical protein ACHAW6_006533 [Cyclotella cf. meneghiniana]
MLVESFHPWWRGGAASLLPTPVFALPPHLPSKREDAIAAPFDHRVITVPPFHDAADADDDGPYPSPLHKIHVLPLLTPEETSHLLRLAESHADANRSWDRRDSTRHVNYNTVDFAVDDSEEMTEYLGEGGIRFHRRAFDALSEAFDVDAGDLSYSDLFCVSYEAGGSSFAAGDGGGRKNAAADRLEFHRDGSLLSFTVLLNSPEEFRGGGTVFDALRGVALESALVSPEGSVTPPREGYATLHCGKLLHGGHVVTSGRRIVLVGFVDVDERNVKEGALGRAAKEWGRNDVRLFWEKRRVDLWKRQHQLDKEEEEDDRKSREGPHHRHPKWILRNEKFLPKVGRSCLGPGFVVPSSILDRMEARANDERIRRRRLRTEDTFLREMLLPRELRGNKIEEGEWKEVEYDEDGVPIGIEIVE